MSWLTSSRIKIIFLIMAAIVAIAASACSKKEQIPTPTANLQQARPEAVLPAPAAPTQPVRPPQTEQSIVPPPPTPAQPARPPQKAEVIAPPPAFQPVPLQQTELLLVVRAFYLEVNGPTDNSMVRDSSINVEGGTLTGSIVTINGKIVALDGRGRFSVPVQLEEGPNSIEIIASDARGNQRSRVISIIRLPL